MERNVLNQQKQTMQSIKSGAQTHLGQWVRGLCALLAILLGLQGPLAQAQTVYYHNDTAGSPIAATDESGNLLWKESYRPYGDRMLKPSASNTHWFHGKQLDPDTGMEDFGARNYDPVLGRFLSIDPVDFQEKNIHSFNRYAYGNNNPLKYKDPDGRLAFLIPIFIWMATGAASAGAVNAGFQYAYTGQVQIMGVGGVVDAASDGVILGPLLGAATSTRAPAVGSLSTAVKEAPDFVVNSRGTAVRATPAGARADLEGAGFRGTSTTETAEVGTMHRNVPGAAGPMDVRIMNGQATGAPFKGPRIRTTRAGADNDGVRSDGSRFRNNESKPQRLEESHLQLPK